MKEIVICSEGMTIEILTEIAENKAKVVLSKSAEKRVLASRKLIAKWVDQEEVIYGITTGFGALSNIIISKQDTEKLQKNCTLSFC